MIVLAARSDQTFCWVPIDALDVGSMTTENSFLVAFVEVPNANRTIVGTGGELRIRGAPAEFKSCASIHDSLKHLIDYAMLTIPFCINHQHLSRPLIHLIIDARNTKQRNGKRTAALRLVAHVSSDHDDQFSPLFGGFEGEVGMIEG